MLQTLGKMPTGSAPAGYFKAISFPVLLKLDQRTTDGRKIFSSGFSTRELPLTIKAQFVQGPGGHVGSEVAGTLFEVTIDPEGGFASGRGFLLDDPVGRRYARMVHLQALKGNSVDLADVEAKVNIDWDEMEVQIDFTKAALAATTGVATPAFAEAYAEVDPLSDDELMASLIGDDPMEELVASFSEFTTNLIDVELSEITASMADTMVAFDDFYVPETDHPQKATLYPDGRVYGHLALDDTCWSDDIDHCIIPPRPSDNYASFNKPGVLTERGIVETGPIMAYGGHRSLKGTKKAAVDMYGGIENAWADVRVTQGRFGPWISGRVRPGVSDETLYAARASRLSGHWLGGKLRAIVSVNVEAYDVPGSGLSTAPFSFSTDEHGVVELVASFPRCMEASEPEIAVATSGFLTTSDQMAPVVLAPVDMGFASGIITPNATSSGSLRVEADKSNNDDELANAQLLALILDDE